MTAVQHKTASAVPQTCAPTWEAAEAAYQLAGQLEREAFHRRLAAGHAVSATREGSEQTNWLAINRDPAVAPLVEAEERANEALGSAKSALIETAAPDWRAFAAKFQVVRAEIDDLLNPLDPRDRKSIFTRTAEFLGSDLSATIHHLALSAHVGALNPKFLPEIAKLLRKLSTKLAEKTNDFDKANLAILIEDAERLATTPAATAPPLSSTDWDAALAKWADLRAQYEAEEASSMAIWRAVAEAAPAEIVEPNLHCGLAIRWQTLNDLDRDIFLSDAEKEALRPLLVEHYARQQEHMSAPERAGEDRRNEELFELVSAAEDELFALTPPTIRALVLKQQIEAREADDVKLGYDDLGWVSYLLGGSADMRNPVRLHMDLLRLAGVHHPMLDMEPFRPAAWIAAYEAAGGFVSAGPRDALLLFPGTELCDVLQGALNATPWKYRAVQLQAEGRREHGGDPVFDAHLNAGRFDNRGGKPKGPSAPYRRVERITFSAQDGATVPQVQSLHRRGDRLVPGRAQHVKLVAA